LRRYHSFVVFAVLILLIAFVGGLVWANILFARYQKGGTSFSVYWVSLRTMLYEHPVPKVEVTPTSTPTPTRPTGLAIGETPNPTPAATTTPESPAISPYSLHAAQNSQKLVYGHLAEEGEAPLFFDIPLHVAIFVSPFATIDDLIVARGIWMLFLEIAMVASVLLCLAAYRFKLRWEMLVFLLLYIICWVYGLWPLVMGDFVIISVFLIALLFWALSGRKDELAGIALGLMTFKFMSTTPLILFILIWGISQKRWRMLAVFVMTVAIFVAVSYLFYPNWIWPYLQAQVANLRVVSGYSPGLLLQDAFPAAGRTLGWIVTAFTTIILATEWWLGRKDNIHWVFWMASLVLVITPFSGLPTFPQNYIVLFPVLVLIISVVAERWGQTGRISIYGVLLATFIGFWAIFVFSRNVVTIYILPPILLTISLYWVRWWFIRPPRTWADSFKDLP
jgi:hypothetical protein